MTKQNVSATETANSTTTASDKLTIKELADECDTSIPIVIGTLANMGKLKEARKELELFAKKENLNPLIKKADFEKEKEKFLKRKV